MYAGVIKRTVSPAEQYDLLGVKLENIRGCWGWMNSEPYSNSSDCTCSHGTGLITRRKVFTRKRMNCSPGSIYVRVRRWSQSVSIPILHCAKWS